MQGFRHSLPHRGASLSRAARPIKRVFVGPVEVSGIAQGLAEGLHALGVPVEVQLSVPHPFQYSDQPPDSLLLRVWQWLGAARNRLTRQQFIRKVLAVVSHNLWGWLPFMAALFRFDAFIFLFGQTFTNTALELWLLRRLRRKIVFIYLGSDARPPYMDGGRFAGQVEDPLPSPQLLHKLVQNCKRQIRCHEHYANYIVNAPATAQFFQQRYINWFAMGLPKTLNMPPPPASDNRPVRILHSPSQPLVKGTPDILACIERLQAQGHAIELVKIQDMPHSHVLQELADCDFVVDQLYSDTPLAGLATEAAFFGKPAVVGGYFAAQMGQYLAAEDTPPSLFVPPEALEDTIVQLITQPAWRHELGLGAQAFVNEHWNARAVAARYLRLLQDDVPAAWWCDPQAVQYTQGCGLPAARTQRLVTSLLQQYGKAALGVADKPQLEATLCALADCDD